MYDFYINFKLFFDHIRKLASVAKNGSAPFSCIPIILPYRYFCKAFRAINV